MMLHMEARHRKIVDTILKKYPYQFYAFGSRAVGTPRRFSDLDLCFKQEIPERTVTLIEAEFAESDLPYTVDLVDWNQCTPSFRRTISKDLTHI